MKFLCLSFFVLNWGRGKIRNATSQIKNALSQVDKKAENNQTGGKKDEYDYGSNELCRKL